METILKITQTEFVCVVARLLVGRLLSYKIWNWNDFFHFACTR